MIYYTYKSKKEGVLTFHFEIQEKVSLINKGLIYATRYGEIDFTVPKFDEFLKRIKANDNTDR